MFSILSGLKRNAILEIVPSWEQLPSKYLETFQILDSLSDPTGGFSNYFIETDNMEPPMIPFFGNLYY